MAKPAVRSSLETFLKSAALAIVPSAAIATVVELRIAEGMPKDSTDRIINWISEYIRWPIDALNALLDLLHLGPIFASAHDFFLGPALPVTTAAVVFSYMMLLLIPPFRGRPLVDRLWPSACHILDHQLEKSGVHVDDAYALNKILLGREEEIQWLMRFASARTSEGAAWTTLQGAEGVGKTHLALAWLRRLRQLGWDVGFLECSLSASQIERAAIRRDTAIVIDDALRRDPTTVWRQINMLLKKSRCFSLRLHYFIRKPARLRILLIDQVIFEPPDDIDLDRHSVEKIELAHHGGLRLSRLSDSNLRSIAPGLPPEAIREADGRPLYVLLGENWTAELARRAERRLNQADSVGKRILALAALVGPLSQTDRKEIPETSTSIRSLERIFEGESKSVLATTIPGLQPMPFGDELLLRWAADQPELDWQGLFRAALAINPTAVAYRLASLWRRRISSEERQDLRAAMQSIFDEIQPGVVSAIHSETERLVGLVQEAVVLEEEKANQLLKVDPWQEIQMASMFRKAMQTATPSILSDDALGRMEWFLQCRPFDPQVRTAEAFCAVYEILELGKSGRFADFQESIERLSKCAAAFPGHWLIRVAEAIGLIRAIAYSGLIGRFSDLECWGAQLTGMVEAFPDNSDIWTLEASGAYSAICVYMSAERFDELELWGNRLAAAVAAAPANQVVAGVQARAAMMVMLAYGRDGWFDDLERWGRRLAKIATTFPENLDIRLLEAVGANNAM